jgi:hypothetical protein
VKGCLQPFLVDRGLVEKAACHIWHYDARLKCARASIYGWRSRITLHKYLLQLKGIQWEEVYFNNGNRFDFRLVNLVPYRREEEGARRKVFKGKRIPYKGVSLKSNGKYVASIRSQGHLKHLGYFNTPEAAADAYKAAYNLIHHQTEI